MHAAGDLTSQNHPLDFLMSQFNKPGFGIEMLFNMSRSENVAYFNAVFREIATD
jgi:hypothetical protein